MADKRKLLGDIDRCHKKVAEGVESFKETWKKLQQHCNPNQKEKYEQDLKKEIKKLQRLRDQIKTWCASNEVKDKRPLLEDRKLIETQMETFKIVERDSKTKAYSKEALGLPAKIDPAEREKCELRDWLNKTIVSLNIEIDKLEADIETMQSQNRKGKSKEKQSDQIEELQDYIAKHRWHTVHLEALLRMLDNDQISLDGIKEIQESVDFYLTDYKEPDFVDDEYLYADIVDPELLNNSNLADNKLSGNLSDNEDDNESNMDDSFSYASHDSHTNMDCTDNPPTSPSSKSSSSKPSKPTPPAAPVAVVPAPRSRHPTPNSTVTATPVTYTTTATPVHTKPPTPKVSPTSVTSPPMFSTSPPASTTCSLYTNHHVSNTDSIRSPPSVPVPSAPGSEEDQEAFVLDAILGVSPLGPLPLTTERLMQLDMLEAAAMNLPQPSDSNRMRSLSLISSFPNFPAQVPSHHYHSYDPKHNFDSFDYFKRLVPDTLFFIFYFYEGTRAQYYAAKALKAQHWRFHKKIKMWFQRLEEPKEIEDAYETGTYVYFDIEHWQQRKKEDFKFEYKFLEEEC